MWCNIHIYTPAETCVAIITQPNKEGSHLSLIVIQLHLRTIHRNLLVLGS